jgi:tetratricopeptide (TPR) repeat protein
MPDIGNYTETTTLVLGEAGKYFALLVFCVLAIRLWRRWAKIPASRNAGGLLMACTATVLAIVIGCVSMRQSLGSLYSYYGIQAFREDRLPQALVLFETADRNWRKADTLGQRGVCLLMLGDTDRGLALISQARILRKGRGVLFEDFYEGLYYFVKGDIDRAVPLLEAASADDTYHWSVIKIFAVINLDANRVADATRLMQPFLQVEVTEYDHAYIMASLKFAEGKKAEARAMLDKFHEATLTPAWQRRFEKLRAKLQE